MENKKWYAVMTNRDDNDWGIGSYDRDEAERMVANRADEYPDGHIAVIDEGNGTPKSKVCVEEIYPDDFDRLNYCAYKIISAKDWGFLDEEFAYLAHFADMDSEWESSDGDNVEDIIREIGKKLGFQLI